MKHTFPANYGEDCIVVEIDKSLVPLVSGALRPFEQRYSWVSEEDYERGYNAFAELQAQFMGKCLRDLVESNERLYRLLDSALNGTQYSAAPNPADPARPLISPAIPAAPPASTDAPNALRAHLGRLQQLAENAATGVAYPAGSGVQGSAALDYNGSWRARLEALQGTTGGFFGLGATPVQLSDLLQAGRVNTAADQGLINNGVEEILSTASAGGNVAQVISNIIGTGANVATDGGALAATIAAAIAQAATAGALAAQLDRIIRALDGGAIFPPAGNVLEHLSSIDDNLTP